MQQTLKDQVHALEQTLLAIDCFSNICTTSTNNHVELRPSDTAFLLEHLIGDSMFKVEALRMAIDALPSAPAPVPAA